ncbi:hypothetical protein [Pseudofrankia sp. BMG5.36]|uniref:hypothetical protein n=1 Tax=Pseudofrankia sp. BMG5.36 TaxID=1834512 RepID=UPI0010426455|nr:hypothetical protein [Pseudofrankia sp. BMG5.36]
MCEIALSQGGEARAAAIEAGYLPALDADRAAYLVLTDQWDRYHESDPDGRLLAAAYRARPASGRDRIRAACQRGRVDTLQILVGDDRRAGVRDLNAETADYLLESLISAGRCQEAWSLVFDLRFEWGLLAAARLRDADILPERSSDAPAPWATRLR